MSYKVQAKKANDLLASARVPGTVVWWRRGGYHTEQYRDSEPKWHILSGRESRGHDGVWIAKCGYKHLFREQIFLDFPKMRKTPPVKSTRCTKCATAILKPEETD